MTGWDISCSRVHAGLARDAELLLGTGDAKHMVDPATSSSTSDGKLADGAAVVSWSARVTGLRWVDDLVTAGRAVRLGGDGFPYAYLVRASDVAEALMEDGRPWEPSNSARFDDDDQTWRPRVRRVVDLATRAGPSEWLLLEAWDQS